MKVQPQVPVVVKSVDQGGCMYQQPVSGVLTDVLPDRVFGHRVVCELGGQAVAHWHRRQDLAELVQGVEYL